MNIETRAIDTLRPYGSNPRRNIEEAAAAVAKSIQEFGYVQPLVVDEEGEVIIGHARLAALQRLGWTEVPVVVKAGLSESQKRALRIADNRLGEIAEWDDAKLAAELAHIPDADADDLRDLLGFNEAELMALSADVTADIESPYRDGKPHVDINAEHEAFESEDGRARLGRPDSALRIRHERAADDEDSPQLPHHEAGD